MECEYCKTVLKTKNILKSHLLNNKSCLKIRGLQLLSKFTCKDCSNSFTSNINLNIHLESCKKHIITLCKDKYELKLNEMKLKLECKNKELFDLRSDYELKISSLTISNDEKVKCLQTQLDKMFSTIEKLASQAINKPTTINNSYEDEREDIDIPIPLMEQMSSIIIEDVKEDVEYSNITLNNVVISSRPIDHYVNATQLCQAGGKKFNDWFRLDTTKELMNELSSEAGIPVSLLAESNRGRTSKYTQRLGSRLLDSP